MRYTHFSKIERLELSILLKKGYSRRAIALALKRSHSSVVRELKRNKVEDTYDPSKAHHKAYVQRKYSKYQGMKVRENTEIEQYIWEKMQPPYQWSPEQIAGKIRKEKGVVVSYNAIYKYLYHNSYGNYLCRYLKYKRYGKKRRKQTQSVRALIPNRVWIDMRPEEVNYRLTFGHFEGDTMGRSRYASQQTLTVMRERKSRKLFAFKVPRLKYAMEGFKRMLSPYQRILESITFDNGVENVRHGELGTQTYFCHPYSSWEKGSVENGIGLIREYIPKKSDLKNYSHTDIAAIVDRTNNTPMKCLGWLTPNEVFDEELKVKLKIKSLSSRYGKAIQLAYPQWCT